MVARFAGSAGITPSNGVLRCAVDARGWRAGLRLLWDDHAAGVRATHAAEMQARVIELDGRRMRFEILSFGDTNRLPAGGRSLFLSMHGGGQARPEVSDSQWRNQIRLGTNYAPAEGLYLAPRAPTDTWNLWHEAHIDRFFSRLIENLLVLERVNPDRVYLMGTPLAATVFINSLRAWPISSRPRR